MLCVSSGGDSQVWRQWQRRRSALLSFLLVGASTLAVLVSPRARFLLVSPFSVRLSLEAQLLMPPAAISCAVDASQHHIDWCNCFGQNGSGSTHTA